MKENQFATREVLGAHSQRELEASSGIYENDGVTPVTNADAIKMLIEHGGAGQMTLSQNGLLPKPDAAHNSLVTASIEAKDGKYDAQDYKKAIVRMGPPQAQ